MPKAPTIHKPFAKSVAKVHQAAVPNYGVGRGGRPWRRKRERILKRDHGLCQPCQRNDTFTLATQVDHVIPKADGGTDDDSNLQSICGPCHDAKSKAEAKRGISSYGHRQLGAQ